MHWSLQPLGMEITTTSSVYPTLLLDKKSSALIDNLKGKIQAVFESNTPTDAKLKRSCNFADGNQLWFLRALSMSQSKK